MRILITGGAGFIGSHLCDCFLRKGYEVVCMDNLLTGRADNIAAHLGNHRFSFIHYDVTEYIHVEGPLDFVMHFASPASPADFERLGIRILKVGALGTHKTLGLARAKGAKFFLASTSEVYGDPQVHPQREDYCGNVDPIGVRGVYDEAKRFAESMVMAYNRLHGIDTRIVRIFNTYGPGMRRDDGRAIPNFITQALAGEDVTVYGDGSQTRSIGYVSDLIVGICKLMDSDINEPVNIGNPVEISMKVLAEKIIEFTGSSSKVVLQPIPDGLGADPKNRLPDVTRARTLLKWEPTVMPDDGLRRTIEWFRDGSISHKESERSPGGTSE
ncbi:MAG: UDP-glucuronic acid decarboxylase family protein [Candidatus Latescibacterota bacterium]|nr:UDP-glucuronic acid decarboxylase family protein [Candidatus Latescibacterota bacterium]